MSALSARVLLVKYSTFTSYWTYTNAVMNTSVFDEFPMTRYNILENDFFFLHFTNSIYCENLLYQTM